MQPQLFNSFLYLFDGLVVPPHSVVIPVPNKRSYFVVESPFVKYFRCLPINLHGPQVFVHDLLSSSRSERPCTVVPCGPERFHFGVCGVPVTVPNGAWAKEWFCGDLTSRGAGSDARKQRR